MYRKIILAAALAASFAAPAFAATYYVAQNATSHKCSVTTSKPDGTKIIQIGTSTFSSKSAAEKAMDADAACKAG
jgi:hypothetical protein